MDNKERCKISKQLEKDLNYKRFIHTMGVAYTSSSLAMRYGVDVEKAEMAGMLHDCAKCLSVDKMMSLCKKGGLTLSEIEKNNPALLHSKAGSIMAREEYGIKDPEILSAIACHTTGKPAMTQLEKIVFTADYIEPGRTSAKRLKEIRQMAFIDLEEAVRMILSDTLAYLKSTDAAVDPETEKTYNYYALTKEKD